MLTDYIEELAAYNMDLATTIARMRDGLPVTTGHNTFEAARRNLLAEGINPHSRAVNSLTEDHDAKQGTKGPHRGRTESVAEDRPTGR